LFVLSSLFVEGGNWETRSQEGTRMAIAGGHVFTTAITTKRDIYSVWVSAQAPCLSFVVCGNRLIWTFISASISFYLPAVALISCIFVTRDQ
jgi:hypothetical protein